jgi:hypothetical protein
MYQVSAEDALCFSQRFVHREYGCGYHEKASQPRRAKKYTFCTPESSSHMIRDARLSILTAQEVDDLYGLPRFTEDDRRLYFDLSPV